MATQIGVVLPGDPIPLDSVIPPSTSEPVIQLGPGTLHIPPSTILPVRAGALTASTTSTPTTSTTTIYVDNSTGRYTPAVHDVVIGTVASRFGDLENAYYRVLLPSSTAPQGILAASAFANAASRKTRPNLLPGTVVYARVAAMSLALGEPELECFDERTGKEAGFGELKGGMVADISVGLARRLLLLSSAAAAKANSGRLSVVDVLGQTLAFEIAVGRNGRIWVNSDSCATTVAVIRAIQETEFMTYHDMQDHVAKIVKNLQRSQK
ncbi:exosome complex exonuclease RRP40 [Myxozyma melibiosi]|uniref:Exosome complex exonuclease RRP40 n=1 Tax=Myxozyma melibiosi TaxID=54550 RepID=A0ABR1FEW5_9ASCO